MNVKFVIISELVGIDSWNAATVSVWPVVRKFVVFSVILFGYIDNCNRDVGIFLIGNTSVLYRKDKLSDQVNLYHLCLKIFHLSIINLCVNQSVGTLSPEKNVDNAETKFLISFSASTLTKKFT